MPHEVKQVFSGELFIKKTAPSTEHLMSIFGLQKVNTIQAKMAEELAFLKNGQDLITLHHKVLKEINNLIEEDGSLSKEKFFSVLEEIKEELILKKAYNEVEIRDNFKESPDLENQLQKIENKFQSFFEFLESTKETASSINKSGKVFSKEQRERLIENVEMDMKELSTENDMQMQKVSRLYNETHESHQSARLMQKTLHDIFMNHSRNIKSH